MSTHIIKKDNFIRLTVVNDEEFQSLIRAPIKDYYTESHQQKKPMLQRVIHSIFTTALAIYTLAALQAYIYECAILCLFVCMAMIISVIGIRQKIKIAVVIAANVSVVVMHIVYALWIGFSMSYLMVILPVLCLYGLVRLAEKCGCQHWGFYVHCVIHVYVICVIFWFYPKVYALRNASGSH